MKKNLIALDKSPTVRRKDDNGFLHVEITPISKAAVNPYYGREIPNWQSLGLEPDGIYYGLRDPKELEKAAPTFNGLPLLLEHHIESAESPAKEHRVGSTGTDAIFEAPYLKNSLSITDAEAIKAVEDGSYKQISCAYRYEPDFKSGEYEGVEYDFVMRNINGNHVALVQEGRAGPDVVVADSVNKELEKSQQKSKEERNENVGKKISKLKMAKILLALDEAIKEAVANELNAEDNELEDEENPTAQDNEIDLTLPIDELIQKYIPGIEGDALLFVKALIERAKNQPGAADNEPEPENEETVTKDTETPDPPDTSSATPGDSEPENTKEAPLTAQDAKSIKADVMKSVRKLNAAANECRFIVGNNLDPLAFDSAEDIYAKALSIAGINYKSFPKEAWRAMVVMHRQNQASKGIIAQDAKPLVADKTIDSIFSNLDKIEVL